MVKQYEPADQNKESPNTRFYPYSEMEGGMVGRNIQQDENFKKIKPMWI